MREGFLKKFIEEERYLQNPPLKTKDFIDFCKKRGVETDERELEFFEKEGLLYPILRSENPRNSLGNHIYIPISFQDFEKKVIGQLFKGNKIIDPSKVDFKPYSTFKDKELRFGNERISNYYSSFQIYWLEILKESYSFKVDLIGDKKVVRSYLTRFPLHERKISGFFTVKDLNNFGKELDKKSNNDYSKFLFDIEKKKEILKSDYILFEKILEFFLSIQEYYYPYGRSASRTISIKQDINLSSEGWWNKRRNFDPKKELENLKINIKEISYFYWLFSKRSKDILGVKRDDWIQLWKNIALSEKDKLEGKIRLGIEYLQWALMLKKFMEDYCKREILDIDEIGSIAPEDIVKVDPSNMSRYGLASLRNSRNEGLTDPVTGESFYLNRYKRLFYLANDFELDYQPRIMVFVEGETEEGIFPKIFECYHNKPENLGIEIVNFKGVDKLLSTSKNAKKLRNVIKNIEIEEKKLLISKNQKKNLNKLVKELKKTDIIVSNWTSFINYNLERWQIIPFFVSDNEGNVKHFLDAEEPIQFEGKTYNVPNEWKYLWGETNKNEPYKGNNFELANFSDEEILLAINQVLDDQIDVNEVKKIREQEEGIKKIDNRIDAQTKRKIVKLMFDNLFKQYEETEDESILKRPIFELVDKILDLTILNHLPVDRTVESRNKEIILDILNGKEVKN
jgi:hypothetical protein